MSNRLIGVLSLSVLLIFSCSDRKPLIMSFNGYTQGTTYSIIYDNNKNISPEVLREKVEKILHDFDMSLSIYNDSSIISRLNRNEDIVPDTYFKEVFEKSAQASEMTGGAFDITVGPLVKAWGFGPDARKKITESKHDSLMKLIGMDKVSLINGKLVKSDPAIFLDVNAIAQGYSVDIVCRFLDGLGIRNYLVEIGGEVRARGLKAGARWRIGIDKPEDNNMTPGDKLEAIITITDRSLSTSGNYRKFYIENGIKYSHTIDPRTGYPARNKLLSATILAGDCAMADCIATACMVMGKEGAIDFITSHPQFSAFFVFSDDQGTFMTWCSPDLEGYITETAGE